MFNITEQIKSEKNISNKIDQTAKHYNFIRFNSVNFLMELDHFHGSFFLLYLFFHFIHK